MGVVLALGMSAVVLLTFFFGFGLGINRTTKREVRDVLRKVKLTQADLLLYRRAAKILNRLVNVTELQGDLAADILSKTSRTQVEEWLAEYNKEIDKV